MARTTSWTLLAIFACIASRVTANLPDAEVAGSRAKAVQIFNSVHSAMRQWGSSIHHNGVAFIPVTVPAGNLLYHGGVGPERPVGPDWLAFEIDHATPFTMSKSHKPPRAAASVSWRHAQHPIGGSGTIGDDDHDGYPLPSEGRAYLQTYRATRDLNLVYIDGQSAAKSDPLIGTQDSQDYVLLDGPVEGPHYMADAIRAKKLCELGASWGGIDGWLRTEAGFEIIYCDFGSGLDLLSAAGVGSPDETGIPNGVPGDRQSEFNLAWFKAVRAATAQFNGLPAGRALVDFSAMVSAFAYRGVNATNPDSTRAELPRLVSTPRSVLLDIRARLRDVARARRGLVAQSFNWQAVTDHMISRYSRQIGILAMQTTTPNEMRSELMALLNLFLEYPAIDYDGLGLSPSSYNRCYQHYFDQSVHVSSTSWTPEDLAIKAALMTVQRLVCDTLFGLHKLLKPSAGGTSGESGEKAAAEVRERAQALMDELRWSTWKECGGCSPVSEVCMVPMYPVGLQEDYDRPRCKNSSQVGWGYWVAGIQF